jgi:hypothetical protein
MEKNYKIKTNSEEIKKEIESFLKINNNPSQETLDEFCRNRKFYILKERNILNVKKIK